MPRLTNRLSLPQPLVDAVANDDYSRGNADISVTQLISPPRKVELERRHADEIEEDASDRVFSLMGRAVHVILERAGRNHEGRITEERLYADVLGWRISGQLDSVVIADGLIQDWKTASVWEQQNGVKPEREEQLNAYAFLARENGFTVNKLEAVFIFRDWSKIRASRERSYPQQQVAVVELPLWSPERAERFVYGRVSLHQSAREGNGRWTQNGETADLPFCTPEERWQEPDVWAVYKGSNKRATKLCDWEAEAQAFAATLPNSRIELRQGESKRCAFYCSALPFCDQGKALVGNRVSDGTSDDAEDN